VRAVRPGAEEGSAIGYKDRPNAKIGWNLFPPAMGNSEAAGPPSTREQYS